MRTRPLISWVKTTFRANYPAWRSWNSGNPSTAHPFNRHLELFERRSLSSTGLGAFRTSKMTDLMEGQLHSTKNALKGFKEPESSTMQETNDRRSQVESSVPIVSSHNANIKASFDSVNPVDIYREHIADALAPIVGLPAQEILHRLQWTLTQDKGDLMLPVPALRIKGKKPAELATEWVEKVCGYSTALWTSTDGYIT